MKNWLEIREMIERIDKFLEHHGGPFGEGVEPQLAYKAALEWVLDGRGIRSVLDFEE